jgi:hypothetical protein
MKVVMKLKELATTEQLEQFFNGTQAILLEIISVKKNTMTGSNISPFSLTIYNREKSIKAL